MGAAQRIPNKLKFSFVASDKSKIEGTFACTDKQWEAIWEILLERSAKGAQASGQQASEGAGE